MSDWLEDFMAYTDGLTAPEIFRYWAGIGALAGAMERRLWIKMRHTVLYPNMYILLVAPPGVGKGQVIKPMQDLWRDTKTKYNKPAFHVAPDNMTKASLIDNLSKSDTRITYDGGLIEYHCMLIASPEFGVLMPSYETEYVSTLNDIYDNPRVFWESRRHGKPPDITIANPMLNLVAGTQPGYLNHIFPDMAWSTGITSRFLMVYSGGRPTPEDIFDGEAMGGVKKENLVAKLHALSELYGEFTMGEGVKEMINDWNRAGCPPIPEHSRLTSYLPRRIIHALKLAMVASISRSHELIITIDDIQRAVTWLFDIEKRMPDIFTDMLQRSDSAVIEELHLFMWATFAKTKMPIPKAEIYQYLSFRAPAEKIPAIIQLAERMEYIKLMEGLDAYAPRPKKQL